MDFCDNRIIYKNFFKENILQEVIECINNKNSLSFKTIGKLIDIASTYGFDGNIWQSYLTLGLILNENTLSLNDENNSQHNTSTFEIAQNEMELFYTLFNFNLSQIISDENTSKNLLNYTDSFSNIKTSDNAKKIISDNKSNLKHATDARHFTCMLTTFYSTYGCGNFALCNAFRVEENKNKIELVPIINTQKTGFDEIIGYDLQKQELIQNTTRFTNGQKSNNVLLFGESGTGKSTCIRAILDEFADQKIKMIEVYKHQIQLLNKIISQIKNRGLKFIIYMDDLSFEEYEIEYKHLKAVIEGGLETRPENVLLYATSNRRNLVREQWSDRMEQDNDIHSTDTMQEKLSLASRFGINIYFPSPNNSEFKDIVINLAQQFNIDMDQEELLKKARKWELRHGGLSGRTARQFITYLND